jgi:hypothetical protein
MNKLYKNGNGDGDLKFMEDLIDFLCKEKEFQKNYVSHEQSN